MEESYADGYFSIILQYSVINISALVLYTTYYLVKLLILKLEMDPPLLT